MMTINEMKARLEKINNWLMMLDKDTNWNENDRRWHEDLMAEHRILTAKLEG